MFSNKKGMTLIEMLVVVIIVAALAMLAYPSYLSTLEKARAKEGVTLLAHLLAAQENFKTHCEIYNAEADECQYSPSFLLLDVGVNGGKVSLRNINTDFFEYSLLQSQKQITATRIKDNKTFEELYKLSGTYGNDDTNKDGKIECDSLGKETGDKVCSSLGKGNGPVYIIQ